MNCSETRKKLDDLIAGTLDSRAAAAVREHVDACSECADVLRASMRIRDALRTPPPPLDETRRQRILHDMRQRVRAYGTAREYRRVHPIRGWRTVLATASVAAAAIVVLSVVWRAQMKSDDDVASMPSATQMNTMAYLHAANSQALLVSGGEWNRDILADTETHGGIESP